MPTPQDSLKLRRERGAFFTPEPIAEHLAAWAVRDNPEAKVLDPTCGEAVFLLAAGRKLREAGCQSSDLDERLYGVDIHDASLASATKLLEDDGSDAHLLVDDFFSVPTPDQLGAPLPYMDAIVGNPPFVRYQQHVGMARKRSVAAALKQGVRLNGLASSWASLLVHSCAFLKPEGRLAMVLPAELLTVNYAEPVRTWLRRRFEKVHLVIIERLQFADALEKVVLVLAEGSGGCEAFSLYHVEDADDLLTIDPYSNWSVMPAAEGKWTDLLLPNRQRQLFRSVVSEHFQPLRDYGTTELGIVTGANSFFAISEATRLHHGIEDDQVVRISPPGTRHLRGASFSRQQWEELRDAGERVWLLRPDADDRRPGLMAYVASGEKDGVHEAYKCQIRDPWWRPPYVEPPDLFFTYMSHRYPRLIANAARATFLNSMHGVRLKPEHRKVAGAALPLLCLNSVTMLGAELFGRSYGGGILKMEPREAAILPMPSPSVLEKAWAELKPHKESLYRQLRDGRWSDVVKRVDAAVLGTGAGLEAGDIASMLEAARSLRVRRVGREETDDSAGERGSD
ncbi:N-6 DNA methylase [Kribbella sp. NPDC056861]|uniref:N-6 DNA methylase n=1 Tax=Kribbella sp. NPDC056861 TaxID=3154857 RepID=UPI003430FF65